QRLDCLEDRVWLLVEIRDEHEDAAALEVLRHLVERHREVTRPLRLRSIERLQHHVEVLRRRWDVRDDVAFARGAAHAVAPTLRASSSRFPIRARTFGSTKRAPGMACDCISLFYRRARRDR